MFHRVRAYEYTDDRLLADLRLGEPLTVGAYDGWQRARDAASPALLIRRFGSWNEACSRAGLSMNKTRSTTRRWSDDAVVAIVAEYLATPGSPGSWSTGPGTGR